jgi:hypothetical protein
MINEKLNYGTSFVNSLKMYASFRLSWIFFPFLLLSGTYEILAASHVFFKSAKEFKQAIRHFFFDTWPKIARSMIDRINDNFAILNWVSST